MAKNSFKLVRVTELPSNINRGINIDNDVVGKSQIAYLVVFQHQDDNNAVGLHVLIRFVTPDNKCCLRKVQPLLPRLTDGAKCNTTRSHCVATRR